MRDMVRPITRSLLQPPFGDVRGGRLSVFHPLQLFANGEKGAFFYAGIEGSLFTDIAKTTVAAVDGDSIATMNDQSPNNVTASKVNTNQRPKLKVSANNFRRRWEYDGVDDAMSIQVPNMGTNCTVARARPGLGGFITTGVTISGTQSDTTTANALLLIDRPLTAAETASLQKWLDDASGKNDEFNVPYGADTTNEILDIFHSSGHPKRPIIVMCHGGAWRTGSKQSPNVIANKLQHWIPKGYTFVSINYKLDVGTDPLDQCASVAKALAWVQSQAASWGCNPNNIVVMGHSAGAHLTTLMTSKRSYRENAGVRPWLGNVVIDSAAYNIPLIMANPSHLTLYDEPWGIGDIAHQTAGSPSLVIDIKPPGPMFLITSTDTNPDESDGLAGPYKSAVEALGQYVAPILATDFIHADTNINLGLTTGSAAIIAYTAAVDDFLLTHCGLS